MSLDIYLYANRRTEVYERNITHNLGRMAEAAGVYKALWRPEEIGAKKAEDIIPLLTLGLANLEADPAHYRTFEPDNGWGTYEALRDFVRSYLDACKENPDAEIEVSR
jgi:hypothetical protein